ncbi:hypothetical protein JST97_06440 [bacterium]|nr:hypothetical protein [bacterium]
MKIASQPQISRNFRPIDVQAPQPAESLDRLPDVASIDVRANQIESAQAAAPVNTTISSGKKAALLALGLGSALMAAAPSANAHGYGYGRYGYGGGYGYGYHHYSGSNAGAIIGGVIAGAILGGVIQQQVPPPVYYPPQPVYQTPYYDGYNRLICPTQNGGWYVSPDNLRCW